MSAGDFTAGGYHSLHSAAQAANSKNSYFTAHYNLTKSQSLELRYSLTDGEQAASGTTSFENQGVYLTYSYRF